MHLSRRVKRIIVAPEVIFRLLKSEGELFKCTKSDIPVDAEFRGIAHDPSTNMWVIFFSHDSFPELGEAQVCPMVNPTEFERHHVILEEKLEDGTVH